MKCPICEKAGLPDYSVNHVICPQCNSDLKGFLILEQTQNTHKKIINRQRVIFSFIILFLIVLSVVITFFKVQNKSIQTNNIKDIDSTIAFFKNELNYKEEQIANLKSLIDENTKTEILYVVKRGDNLSKIALIFYNDWKMYKKIEKDNSLKTNDIIYPGDTLLIKIIKE